MPRARKVFYRCSVESKGTTEGIGEMNITLNDTTFQDVITHLLKEHK